MKYISTIHSFGNKKIERHNGTSKTVMLLHYIDIFLTEVKTTWSPLKCKYVNKFKFWNKAMSHTQNIILSNNNKCSKKQINLFSVFKEKSKFVCSRYSNHFPSRRRRKLWLLARGTMDNKLIDVRIVIKTKKIYIKSVEGSHSLSV